MYLNNSIINSINYFMNNLNIISQQVPSPTNACYVCFESCNIKSPCDCKSMYLHKNCQINIIKENKKFNCLICKKKYENLTFEIKTYKKLSSLSFMLIYVFIILLIVSISSFISFIILKRDNNPIDALVFSLIFNVSIIIIIIYIFFIIFYKFLNLNNNIFYEEIESIEYLID